ncbi:MAG: cytochrome c3 family protein, partial [Nitrospiraceae bacterium]
HTQTNHHQADGNAPGGQSHNDGQDCRGCHTHDTGFAPSGGGIPAPHDVQDCNTCHTAEPDYATPVTNTACQSCHDSSAPGSNGVGWGDCRTETGTTTILSGTTTRNLSLTTPLADTTKAFLLVDSAGPQSTQDGRDHMVSGYISGANTLTFEREGTSGQAEVSYSLVECLYTEFSVQRGEITLANGVDLNTDTITTIDPARSIVIVNARTNVAADEQYQAHVIGQLVDATTVEVKRAATATSADTFVRYEVVEFGDEAGVTIQKAEFAFNGSSSIQSTLATPVNMDSTWLYFTYWSDDDGPQQTAISGQLTAINKVDFYRYESMAYDNRIRYFVVEFPNNQVTVQRGSSSYLGGASTAVTHDIAISPVSDPDKTFSFVTNTTADKGDGATVAATGTFIEAENYSSIISGTGTLTEVTLGGELNGGTSLQTTNSIAGDCDSVTGGGRAGREYLVNFPTAGTYNIWMRAHAFGNSSNTMFLGFFSGSEPADGCIAAFEVTVYNTWTWTKSMAKNSGPGGNNPAAAQFTVSTPGTYPIRIWARENLNAIDGIFVDTVGNTPSDINHGIEVDPTQGTSVPFPRNRWTEVLTSPSNLQMANWRGDSAGADADFEWQVMEFTGTIGGGGGSDLKVETHFSTTYTDPSTGSLLDVQCVECHNPMSSQSNLKFIRSNIRSRSVVFTAYTGTNSFADGDATNDGICEVCHTATNYHRNDGSEPVQSHNNGMDCRNCHNHLDGMTPNVIAPAPHDVISTTDCTYCHVDNINYGIKIPDSKCEQCHSPGGSLKGSYPTAPDVLTHSDANVPGSLYSYTNDCVDCHDVMWAQTNLAFIRPTLAGSQVPGSPIIFTSYAGTDSFADGPPYDENVCNTCHSQTEHHQSDGTAPGGQSHNDGLDCAGCHPHGEAFAPSTSNCVFCHNQSPPFSSSDPNRRQIVEFLPGDGNGDFTRTSHHVRTAVSSQEIVTKEECKVCHDQSLHETFGDGESVLLTNQDTGAAITYDGTGKSLETFCISCHDADGSIINGAQPFISAGDTNSPIDIGWTPDVVSHSIAGTNQACFNCHGDESGNNSGHGSDNPYIHKYTFVPGQSHLFCYNCHDGSVSNKDVLASFDLPFSHRTGTEECKACHDQHNAEPGLHTPGSENLADMIGGVNKGMGFSYQYEICFICHNTPIAKTDLRSENDMDTAFEGGGVYATYWSTIPDVESQFATSQLAYHPLFAAGRNQPANNLNSEWSTSAYRKDDAAPGGPFDGLDNNFVDGFTSNSLVTCSDCHGNGTVNGARGIHGSDYAWINRRIINTTDVSVTTAGAGTIYPNTVIPDNQLEVASNFCVNCHRADVYGFGSNDFTPTNNNETFSRLSHLGGAARTACQATNIESRKGGYNKIGCANCHGGGEVAGIHGTSLGVGNTGSSEMGKRFMNGNSWNGHTLGDTSGDVSCYTGTAPAIGQSLSSCSQHGGGVNKTPNYYYQWQ